MFVILKYLKINWLASNYPFKLLNLNCFCLKSKLSKHFQFFHLRRYGLISFALVFLVEQLGGILQATLTLNGLIGGVTLGLFSLGVLFRSANAKGALYGGLISLVLVVYVGIMAQLNNVEPTPLSSSLSQCECYSNETMPVIIEVLPTE